MSTKKVSCYTYSYFHEKRHDQNINAIYKNFLDECLRFSHPIDDGLL
jgi:hypothetical protein